MRQAAQAQGSFSPEKLTNRVIPWQEFTQAEPLLLTGSLTLHIAAYFRHVLDKFEDSEFVKYLVAPSPTAVAGYFRCSEEDIYAALEEIKRQGYEYETSGSENPILLWDPLVRLKVDTAPKSFWSHWSTGGFTSA